MASLGTSHPRHRAGLRAAAAVTALAAMLAAGCGGGDEPRVAEPSSTPGATAQPQRRSTEDRAGRRAGADGAARLAVGITEANPSLVWSPAARPVAPPFEPWRRELGRIAPAYYRLVVDWPSLQPSADEPPDLAAANGGCMRTILPCAPYAGLREQLQALASRQREREGGWEAVVVITGSPRWAAGPRAGCERVGTEARSRAPRPGALEAYARLVRGVLDEAKAAGAELRWWSAWNEPNRYVSFSPQRGRCRPGARSIAAARYAALVRVLRRTLEGARGRHGYVLGDLAGVVGRSLGESTVREFIRGLPSDVVCGTGIYAQHSNIGSPDPVPAAVEALAAHGCRERHEVWITQTGALLRRDQPASERPAACRALHERLVRWYRDPSVTAAIQYTFREDDLFRMGLADPRLRRALPALGEWQAWGGRTRPTDPPPKPACG